MADLRPVPPSRARADGRPSGRFRILGAWPTGRHAAGRSSSAAGSPAASVARLLGKRGATIVSPENFMLYTPLLPEAASGTLEPRHVVVPLRAMAPARRAAARPRRRARRRAHGRVRVEAGEQVFWIGYENLVIALGAVARTLPIPGLAEHALGFKDLPDAIALRNHVLRRLEAAVAAPNEAHRRRELSFVFVGAGYAGVEALAELSDLVRDALRYYPTLRARAAALGARRRRARRSSPEIPTRLGDYAGRAARAARRRDPRRHHARGGRAARRGPLRRDAHPDEHGRLDRRDPRRGRCSRASACRSTSAGAIVVGPTLQVEGHERIWALGDGARVPNLATPGPIPTRRPASTRSARRAGWRGTSRGDAEAVPLPDARPGRDARPLQGDRRRHGPASCAASPAGG